MSKQNSNILNKFTLIFIIFLYFKNDHLSIPIDNKLDRAKKSNACYYYFYYTYRNSSLFIPQIGCEKVLKNYLQYNVNGFKNSKIKLNNLYYKN